MSLFRFRMFSLSNRALRQISSVEEKDPQKTCAEDFSPLVSGSVSFTSVFKLTSVSFEIRSFWIRRSLSVTGSGISSLSFLFLLNVIFSASLAFSSLVVLWWRAGGLSSGGGILVLVPLWYRSSVPPLELFAD